MKTIPVGLMLNRDDIPFEISCDDAIDLMDVYQNVPMWKCFKRTIKQAIRENVIKPNKNGRYIVKRCIKGLVATKKD